jgi:hypothetical protein
VVTLGTGLQRYAGDLFVPVTVVFFDFKFGSGRRDLQKLPAQCELLCSASIGEEAVVANTLKSFGQNVEQEPTDELLGDKCHGLVTAVVAIVLPAKLNLPVVHSEQPVVRDGNPMGVSCDVLEDLLRSAERWLGVDLPIYFPGGSDVAEEGLPRPKWLQGGKELQLSGIEGLLQIIEEQPTEQKSQHRNGEDIIRPAGNPPLAVRRNASTGNHAMQMGMVAPTPTIP